MNAGSGCFGNSEEVLGTEEASILMEGIETRGITPEAMSQGLGGLEGRLRSELSGLEGRLRSELGGLEVRVRSELEALDHRMDLLEVRLEKRVGDLRADFLEKINEQTRTLFRTFVVSNAAMVLAMGTLAFGAARLA